MARFYSLIHIVLLRFLHLICQVFFFASLTVVPWQNCWGLIHLTTRMVALSFLRFWGEFWPDFLKLFSFPSVTFKLTLDVLKAISVFHNRLCDLVSGWLVAELVSWINTEWRFADWSWWSHRWCSHLKGWGRFVVVIGSLLSGRLLLLIRLSGLRFVRLRFLLVGLSSEFRLHFILLSRLGWRLERRHSPLIKGWFFLNLR